MRPPEGFQGNAGIRAQAPAQHPHQTSKVPPSWTSFDPTLESPQTHFLFLSLALPRLFDGVTWRIATVSAWQAPFAALPSMRNLAGEVIRSRGGKHERSRRRYPAGE